MICRPMNGAIRANALSHVKVAESVLHNVAMFAPTALFMNKQSRFLADSGIVANSSLS